MMKTLSEQISSKSPSWWTAAVAAAALLKDVHNYEFEKALDPLKEEDYVSLVASLATKLRSTSSRDEKRGLEQALKILDVDWPSLSEQQRENVLALAEEALEQTKSKAIPVILTTLAVGLLMFGRRVKRSVVGTHKLDTSKNLSDEQERIIDTVSEVSPWLALEYERRSSRVGKAILAAVTEGVQQGKTSAQINAEIQEIAPKFGLSYNDNYWLLVADNLLNRVRSYVSLSTFKKVGITKYRFEAVMDERTTLECRMLHGTIFDVDAGLSKYQELFNKSVTDPMALEEVMPFVKRRKVPGGATELYVTDSAGRNTTIGVNTVSGLGQEGAVGSYKNVLPPEELEALGVAVPPIHHGCRSSIIPVR